MQSKFSTFLAVSGLVILTSSNISATDNSNECQRKHKKTMENVFVQVIDTDNRTTMAEWNVGCGNCVG